MKPSDSKKRRKGFKLGPGAGRAQPSEKDGSEANLTVLAPGVAEGADSWGPTELRNIDDPAWGRYHPYDPEDDPDDQPAFDGAGYWEDEDNPHPRGYSPRETGELKDEIRHTRGSWASGWADRSRK